MANRFWIGGSGNWDAATTTNWSTTTGGAGGASVPTSVDSVFVDALSGSSPVITLTATANCLDLTFTGAITPTLAGSSTLTVYGSLTLISAMTLSHSGNISYAATSTGKTITTAGKTLLGVATFLGVGGGWTLQDAYNSASNITQTNGSFATNNMAVNINAFTGSGSNVRTLTLGSSVLTLTGDWTISTTTNLTFSAGTSTIILTQNFANFIGGGLTYNNLSITGNPVQMLGSNTFNVVTIAKGKSLKLTSGTTQTITSLVCNGTTASPSTLQSLTAASAATIALPASRHFIRHTSIKDITVTGATSVTSIAGTNVSGNTGITFVTKFEIGRIKNDGSFNWYSAATGANAKVSG